MKTKQDIIDQIHANGDISKKTIEYVVQSFVNQICNELISGNDVRIYELGTFKVTTRVAHTGRNPATGEAIEIPERRLPQLKFNNSIRLKLNGIKK